MWHWVTFMFHLKKPSVLPSKGLFWGLNVVLKLLFNILTSDSSLDYMITVWYKAEYSKMFRLHHSSGQYQMISYFSGQPLSWLTPDLKNKRNNRFQLATSLVSCYLYFTYCSTSYPILQFNLPNGFCSSISAFSIKKPDAGAMPCDLCFLSVG